MTDQHQTLYDLCADFVLAVEYAKGRAAIEAAEDALIDHFAERRLAAAMDQ